MAGSSTTLVIRILADARQASATMKGASANAGKFATAIGRAALPAAAIGTAALAMGKQVTDAASRTQQAMGALDSVFGKNADAVKEWANTAATAVGLSSAQYSEMASVVGAQLGNMGLSQTDVLGKTKSLIAMGADLAATYGGTTAQAVEALSSALRGETDPIERYGISVKQADIAARQATDGTKKLTGAAGKAAKTNALLALVTEQSAAAHGQFARESDSAAGAQQRATAQMENAQAAIGQGLLPVMVTLGNMLGTGAAFAQKHAGATQALIVGMVALAGAVAAARAVLMVYNTQQAVSIALQKAYAKEGLLYAAVQGVVRAATLAWVAAQWLLNVAMDANPVGATIAVIVLLVAAIVLAYKKSATFRRIVQAAWNGIKAAALAVWNFLKTYVFTPLIAYYKLLWEAAKAGVDKVIDIWDGLKAAFKAVWDWLKTNVFDPIIDIFDTIVDAVQTVIDWIKKIKIPKAVQTIIDKIGGVVGRSAPPPAAAAPAPRTRRGEVRAAPTTGGSGTGNAALAALTPESQVIVQVSDRKMAQLVDVSIRASATSAARDLTRRRVVTV